MMMRVVFIALATHISVVCSTSSFSIMGKKSSSSIDAQSTATCPVSYAVSFCDVYSGGVPSRSDGALVDPGNGRVCVAYNGIGGRGATARAGCTKNVPVANPCNDEGPRLSKFLNLHSRGSAPSVSCPPGYQQVLCNAMSPWYQLLINKGVNTNGVIPNNRRCSVSGCSKRKYCEVTAVCQIMNSHAYQNAVCPDKVTVVGNRSGSGDDAKSKAICPVGYVVSYCEVQTGFVHSKSDGAFVDPHDPRVCVAVNGAYGSGAVARAICSRNFKVLDPCNKKAYKPKFLNLKSKGPAPRVSCPSGYEQILCNAMSPWRGKLSNKGVNTKGVIPNVRSCTVPRCSHKIWCQVTAVCRIKHKCTKDAVQSLEIASLEI